MPVLKLQKIVVENLSVKDVNKMYPAEKGVAFRIFMELANEADKIEMFKNELEKNEGHVCKMKNFNVWHGGNIGPRKFRKSSLCKCVCDGEGKLCKCECGAVFKMIMEYRESEVFRGYVPWQKKHKKARRFIPKSTPIKDLITLQFSDPHPYQRQYKLCTQFSS